MKLSIVVVNFHSVAYVEQCLRAVDPSWCSQVVIVDNSTDRGEAELLSAIPVTVDKRLIVEPKNVGFGAAANDGVDLAFQLDPGSPAWLVNPDMTFEKAVPQLLLERLERGLDDILSPTVVTGPPDDLRVWFAGGSADRETGDVVHDDYLRPYDATGTAVVRSTTFMCGAAPVFTRAAWAALGGFRPDLFLYWEDAELSLRAQDHELRMTVVDGGAPVWHAVGATGGDTGQSEAFYYYSARNRVMIMRERHGWQRIARPKILAQLAKFALRPLRRERTHRFEKFLAVLRGYGAARRVHVDTKQGAPE
jgi:N-acetylglucosaminyl-diphospho-decaprenol L-rhamnosyltransferase